MKYIINKNLVLNTLICLVTIPFYAQHEEEILNDISLEIVNSNLSSKNNSNSYQIGNQNKAVISQKNNFQSEQSNRVILNQNGIQNNSRIIQNTYSSNIMAGQIGNDNALDILIEGEDIKMKILQEGNNNQIRQTITESVDVELNLVQKGNNHSMDQKFNSLNGIEMTIIQKGQNAQLKIIHN